MLQNSDYINLFIYMKVNSENSRNEWGFVIPYRKYPSGIMKNNYLLFFKKLNTMIVLCL